MTELLKAIAFVDKYLHPNIENFTFIVKKNISYWCSDYIEYSIQKGDYETVLFTKTTIELAVKEVFKFIIPDKYEDFKTIMDILD